MSSTPKKKMRELNEFSCALMTIGVFLILVFSVLVFIAKKVHGENLEIKIPEVVREMSYFEFTDENGREVGRLSWENGELDFQGNARVGAEHFFREELKQIVDEYIKNKQCQGKV